MKTSSGARSSAVPGGCTGVGSSGPTAAHTAGVAAHPVGARTHAEVPAHCRMAHRHTFGEQSDASHSWRAGQCLVVLVPVDTTVAVALGSSGSWGLCQERAQEVTRAECFYSFLCSHPWSLCSSGILHPSIIIALQDSPRSILICG